MLNICSEPECAMSLYKSIQGKYFVGSSREEFGGGKYAWAGLFNPPDSGVLLFVNVFTVTNISEVPFSVQVWLNAETAGVAKEVTDTLSPSNIALCPLPKPKVRIFYAENVGVEPSDGKLIYGRRCPANATIVAEEDGKYICPPGSNFLINCISPEKSTEKITGSVAFGWWEEPCY